MLENGGQEQMLKDSFNSSYGRIRGSGWWPWMDPPWRISSLNARHASTQAACA